MVYGDNMYCMGKIEMYDNQLHLQAHTFLVYYNIISVHASYNEFFFSCFVCWKLAVAVKGNLFMGIKLAIYEDFIAFSLCYVAFLLQYFDWNLSSGCINEAVSVTYLRGLI